jgi:membrane protein DedA with SNARE-associated domain
MDDLLIKISQYGYPGLFAALMFGIVGLPIPDETLLVFFGYLVSKGTMHILLTWLTAVAGSVSGITSSYLIGRYAGLAFVHRYGRYIHLTEERLTRVHRWFDQIGHWLLTVGYFIPGVRHVTALVAGMSCMDYRSFALFAYPGAVIWVSTFLGIGYLVGDNWQKVLDSVHSDIMLIVVAVVVVIGGVWYWHWRRQRSRRPSPSQ